MNLFTILNFDFQVESKIKIEDPKIYTIASNINKKFNFSNICKTSSIAQCLTGILNHCSKSPEVSSEFKNEILKITNDTLTQYNLDIDIHPILDIFSSHIFNMLLRCHNNNEIQTNDNLSIKESCFFVYDIAVTLANHIAKKYMVTINQNEISLISMHLGFLIEESIRSHLEAKGLNVLLHTSQYIYNSHFIDKIKEILPANSNIISISEIHSIDEIHQYDLLITTNKSVQFPLQIPICYVRPIIANEDISSILQGVKKVTKKRKLDTFKNLFHLYFSEDLFFISSKLTTKEKVLDFMCDSLKKKNYINDDFKSSLLLRETIASTDISNMYAIPHAMEFIANKTIMSVYINKNGIQWNDSKVKMVFLCAINKKNVTNLRIIYDFLIEMVSDPETFSRLSESNSMQEFSEILFS